MWLQHMQLSRASRGACVWRLRVKWRTFCTGAQDELHRAFDNCEMRSVVITDAAGGGKIDTTWWPGGRAGL